MYILRSITPALFRQQMVYYHIPTNTNSWNLEIPHHHLTHAPGIITKNDIFVSRPHKPKTVIDQRNCLIRHISITTYPSHNKQYSYHPILRHTIIVILKHLIILHNTRHYRYSNIPHFLFSQYITHLYHQLPTLIQTFQPLFFTI